MRFLKPLAIIIISVAFSVLLIGGDDNLGRGLLSPGGGGLLSDPNPFNQSLNTDSAVVFSTASVSAAFEVGSNATISGDLIIGSTSSTSLIIEPTDGATGSCIVVYNTAGTLTYMRVVGTTLTINTTSCL